MIRQIVNKDDLCRGPAGCPEATRVVCDACDSERSIDDDYCSCGHGAARKLRCDSCPLDRLDDEMNGPHGRLIRRAMDLQSALGIGLTLTTDDMTTEEFRAIVSLRSEMDRREQRLAEERRRRRG